MAFFFSPIHCFEPQCCPYFPMSMSTPAIPLHLPLPCSYSSFLPPFPQIRHCSLPQACRNKMVQHLEHLLFYGADMNAQNASGNTPLHVCAVNNLEDCARVLLFRGCNKNAINYANQTPYQVRGDICNLEWSALFYSSLVPCYPYCALSTPMLFM